MNGIGDTRFRNLIVAQIPRKENMQQLDNGHGCALLDSSTIIYSKDGKNAYYPWNPYKSIEEIENEKKEKVSFIRSRDFEHIRESFFDCIWKEYPDGIVQLKMLKQKQIKIASPHGEYDPDELTEEKKADNLKRRSSRIKTDVFDLAVCNEWSHFVTLTLDPDKFNDVTDLNECGAKVGKWLNNYKRYDDKFRYVLIPERHKSGALHFHLLAYFGQLELLSPVLYDVNGKGKRFKQLDDGKGHLTFNIDHYGLGYSSAIELYEGDNYAKRRTASYLTKYITKELLKGCEGHQILRTSKGLNRPHKETFSIDKLKEFTPELLRSARLVYDNERSCMFEFDNFGLPF